MVLYLKADWRLSLHTLHDLWSCPYIDLIVQVQEEDLVLAQVLQQIHSVYNLTGRRRDWEDWLERDISIYLELCLYLLLEIFNGIKGNVVLVYTAYYKSWESSIQDLKYNTTFLSCTPVYTECGTVRIYTCISIQFTSIWKSSGYFCFWPIRFQKYLLSLPSVIME